MGMVDFIGSSYIHRSSNVSPQISQNLYQETIETNGAKSQVVLIGTPGTQVFADISVTNGGNCRGLWFSSTSLLYGVFGDTLYSFDAAGAETIIGVIGNTGSPVSMTDNGKYLFITDSVNFWYNELGIQNLKEINLANTDLEKPTKIVYINSRVVAIDGTNKFYWSNPGLEGGLVFEALSFATAEQSADNIISIEKRQNDIWLFGDRSYEVWTGTGDVDWVFTYRDGSASDIGCGAIRSTSSIAENVFWLGSSTAGQNQIFVSNGFNAQRISNHYIEKELDDIVTNPLTSTTDAISFTYQQEGHMFYVITFKGGNKTFVYDMLENQWHNRSTRDPNLNIQNSWDSIFAVYAYGKVITGSDFGARLFTLSLDKFDEWDERPIVRERISPVYWDTLRNIVADSFTVDIETGVGIATGQGSDPEISLAVSRDGGHVFSSEITTKLGKSGQYLARAKWNRLGRSRAFTMCVRISDPVKVVMLGAKLNIRQSRHP